MQRQIDGYNRLNERQPAAQVEHGAERGRDGEALEDYHVRLREGASAYAYACPGRHATRVRYRDFDRITRWKIEAVEPRGGPVGECSARREAAADRSEDDRRGLRHPCPGIEAG